jgi:5-methyltetrahydrofolate--homocysteine methyltransferase
VWVKDASRAVGVAQSLVSKELVDGFMAKIRAEYAEVRERHRNRGPGKQLVPMEKARAHRFTCDWASYEPPQPAKPGLTVFHDYDVAELREYIDWTPFFQAWELAGHYPAILTDEVVGAQATELFADAQAMLDRIVVEKWLTARAVIGFWPAANVGDDIVLLPRAGGEGAGETQSPAPEEPSCPTSLPEREESKPVVLHHLRQQADKPIERPNLCLSDFIAPKEFGKRDWIGGFAVTAGLGIEPHLQRFQADHDDYSAITLKALADRLAEAFAERMHERVRREFWGYAANEALDNAALIAEKYQGVRPAPGYPACPDHTEKTMLFRLLDATANAGIELTEGFSMYPAAAVSGWYFSHPDSQYFVVGRLTREQVEDYAKRKGWSREEAERWLASNLDYDPE